MAANLALRRRLDQLGLTQDELAARLNAALQEITGRPGEISSRTVRNLLNGSSRRPIGRTCAALERVFGCPVADLGFRAPSSMQHPPEAPCGDATSSFPPPERQPQPFRSSRSAGQ
ncbi:helix-turn-helix domain-containing protein [Streptomyces sp. HF10]|uniref:helix-turn-helix domain-containing protein n=1 Tax=Streptomyces sp. HF10 TaxID=2692233 RepID=UPI001F365644|nr:helix-turn-helix transcriptional regulator [Streptomyces sp. HF10]